MSLASPFSRTIHAPQFNGDDYADEAGDASALVGTINPGELVQAWIGPADANDTYGDKDVFKVLLTQGQSYEIRMQSSAIGGQALPLGIFTLRDGADFNHVLATSPIGANVALNFSAPATGYYYLRAGTGGAATDQGSYQLVVNSLSGWSIVSTQSGAAEDAGSVTFTITRPGPPPEITAKPASDSLLAMVSVRA